MSQVHRLDNNQLSHYRVPTEAKGAQFLGNSGLIKAWYEGRWQVYCPWQKAWYEDYNDYYTALCEAVAALEA